MFVLCRLVLFWNIVIVFFLLRKIENLAWSPMMKKQTNRKGKKASRLLLSFVHTLKYKYVAKGRKGFSAKEQTFLIDGQSTPHSHHPLSLHGTRTKKARPRVQLTEEHSQRLQLPMIDEQSGEVTEIIFPNGRVNYVLLARRNSSCPALRALHKHMDEHGAELDEFCQN